MKTAQTSHSSDHQNYAVPSSWKIRRIKYVATYNTEVLPENTPDEYQIVYVDISSVDAIRGIHNTETLKFADAPSRARRIARHGDIIVSTVRTYLKAIAAIRNPPENMIVSTGFAVIRPNSELLPDFAAYLFQSDFVVDELIARSNGVSYPAINASELVSIKVPVPSKAEQRAIIAYLDRETAEINDLIARQQRLITLLQEKRQAVISQAVTKGIDPHVPMKQSGIEWLGEVPAHWGVLPTRYVARLESGHTPSRQHPEYWENCTIPWFSLSDVWQVRDERKEYVNETSELVSELGITNSSARVLPKGTVLLSRTASVGFSAIMGVDMATTQDFANWVCGPRMQPEYLLYILRAMKPEFSRLTMGSTHQTIYMPDLHDFRCPLPPIEEQNQIVSHIRCELADIDAIAEKCNAAIKLLQERRTALIAAAVTGKIDVRSVT